MNKITVTRTYPSRQCSFEEALRAEFDRLENGPEPAASYYGIGLDAQTVTCSGNAGEVMERARQVMLLINRYSRAKKWPTDREWMEILPDWFPRSIVVECEYDSVTEGLEEQTRELLLNDERYEALRGGAYRVSDRWDVEGAFLGWMSAEMRNPEGPYSPWFWWDTTLIDDNRFVIYVERHNDYMPAEPCDFRYLIQACGAAELDEEVEKEYLYTYLER